jgi:ATP-dependent Clp protease ATP-binding subunit ClpA
MIAQELEVCLHRAFVDAREKRHELITAEHLLLAILDGENVEGILTACGADPQALHTALITHIGAQTPRIPDGREVNTQPSLGFQRVIQRAILKVQSSGKKTVGSSDVLLAIFGEKTSRAAQLLQQELVTPEKVVSCMSASGAPPTISAPPVPGAAEGAIAQDLEVTLHTAFVNARQQRHEFITVEHLLLALLDHSTIADILRSCGADMDALRTGLTEQVTRETPRVAAHQEVDTQPTLGFQRVLQRAILHVQATGKKEVNAANVLVALLGDKDSHAVSLLQQQGVNRLDVVTAISHGVVSAPAPDADPAAAGDVQVVIYNDDYTPMEFVVGVLERFFDMSREDAAETMLEIHREGAAVCGLYPSEDGEDIVRQVTEHARANGHPLGCAAVVPKA